MSEKMYLHLLFFSGILCQGIFATLSDKGTKVSTNVPVRNRRVINHLPNGRISTPIEEVKYIVKIKEGRRAICAGVILSHYSVITAASCLRHHISSYQILSGGTHDNRSNTHDITSKVEHFGNLPRQDFDGIALITVDPLFSYTPKTGNIPLYLGTLPTGTPVTVFGWGFYHPLLPGTEERHRLRSITLPIMNHEECRNDYRNLYAITDKYLCTYHDKLYCARTDAGAPLVFNNRLAGIHVWKGEYRGRQNPDVFINLQHADYSGWIREHTLLM